MQTNIPRDCAPSQVLLPSSYCATSPPFPIENYPPGYWNTDPLPPQVNHPTIPVDPTNPPQLVTPEPSTFIMFALVIIPSFVFFRYFRNKKGSNVKG